MTVKQRISDRLMVFVDKYNIILMSLVINVLYYMAIYVHPEFVGTLDGLILFHFVGTVFIIFKERDGTDLLEYGILVGFWVKHKKPVRFLWVWYLSIVHLMLIINWDGIRLLDFNFIVLVLLWLGILPWKAFFEIIFFLLKNLLFSKIFSMKYRKRKSGLYIL